GPRRQGHTQQVASHFSACVGRLLSERLGLSVADRPKRRNEKGPRGCKPVAPASAGGVRTSKSNDPLDPLRLEFVAVDADQSEGPVIQLIDERPLVGPAGPSG